MQPVSGPGAPLPGERSANATTPAVTTSLAAARSGDQPLTPAQRTTLENLVLKVAALTTSKAAEVWSNVRQGLGLTENAELQSRHYQPAEQLLQTRLTQAQDNGERQQLLQRVTDMLSQGNNRQAVSDFIRQQFGHTVLGSLSKAQLKQVVTLLQHGQMPLSTTATGRAQATANAPDRPLRPAEQNSLNQLVNRLAAQTGEPSARIWTTLMTMQNLTTGDAIPLKNLQVLTQFLQTQVTLQQASQSQQASSLLSPSTSQQAAQPNAAGNAIAGQPAPANSNSPAMTNATLPASSGAATTTAFAASPLAVLQGALPQPLSTQEQQMLLDYTQVRFAPGLQTPLTPMQIDDVLTFLFTQRLQRAQESDGATSQLYPPPLFNPLIASLPLNWQALFHRPLFLVIVSLCVVSFLLWILL
ncbi:flagella biosynthesis regulator Flk [Brenneria izbisi]|uniref:Flagella biosynthesis regulator Flk n=1 Tax=Brenneria izbisi TaxID=2939450 RepID=A0AA41XYH7_9GAMM|nr:flagella biosynthesis regulator Flk [Brenneria izbisi]MCV9879540.1 flagella biosynthesis regulator Flk [Brenneria izbisi]MCV9882929.1 flagella biosynthesis regulator Flk [Brenneria izbisi]